MNSPRDALFDDHEIELLRHLPGQEMRRIVAPQLLPGTTIAVETLVVETSDGILALDARPEVVNMSGDADEYFVVNITRPEVTSDLRGTSFYFGSGQVIESVQVARWHVRRVGIDEKSAGSSLDTGVVIRCKDGSSIGLFSTTVFMPELTFTGSDGDLAASEVPDVNDARTSSLDEFWISEVHLLDVFDL